MPFVRLAFALLAAVLVTGAFLLPARVRWPLYFPVLELHRLVAYVALGLLPLAVALHTGKAGWWWFGASMAIAAGVVAAGPVLGALDFPEPMTFLALQAQALRGDDEVLLDSAIVRGAGTLVAVLGVSVALVLAGVLTRPRERESSRWSGLGLCLVTAWAMAGGVALSGLPREQVFAGLTMHSLAGTATIGLWVLHRGASWAAGGRIGRFGLATGALAGLLALAALWWWHYEEEHFAGFRPARIDEGFRIVRTRSTAEERHSLPDAQPPLVKDLANAASCGTTGCHTEIVTQWSGSPHRYAASNRFYRAALKELVAAKGAEEAQFCANCHDPARALAGLAAADAINGGPPSESEGVGCEVCHTITEVAGDPPDNGRFAVKLPRPYPGEGTALERRIRLDPRDHRQSFVTHGMTLSTKPCESCHRVRLDEDLGLEQPHVVQEIRLFDGGEGSGSRTCTGCHLPQQEDSLYTHRMAGLNGDLDLYAELADERARQAVEAQRSAVEDFVGVRIAGPISDGPMPRPLPPPLLPEGLVRPGNLGMITLRVDVARDGDALALRATTLNLGIGHGFPAGPLDLHEVWMEWWVRDANGAVVFHEGAPQPGAELGEGLVRLGGREIGPDGKLLEHHRIFELKEVRDRRMLERELLHDERRVVLPDGAVGPFEVRARWLFRRAPPRFVRWATEGSVDAVRIWEIAGGSGTGG